MILSIDTENVIDEVVESIKEGGLVVLPTDTCYGVVCDATNDEAVTKLYSYKSRDASKPTGIYVLDLPMAERFVEISIPAMQLYGKYFPGALTLISKSRGNLAKTLEINGTLGVRIPDHSFILDILRQMDVPLAQTSANIGGEKTPYSLSDITIETNREKLKDIAVMVDAGILPSRPPSTVVDASSNSFKIIRQGDLIIEV